jgi:glycerate-2-kinase
MNTFEHMSEQRNAEEKMNFISEQLSAVLESNIRLMVMIENLQKEQKIISAKCDSLQQLCSKLAANNKDIMIMSDNIEKEIEDVYAKTEDISTKCDNLEFAVHNIKIYKSVNDF